MQTVWILLRKKKRKVAFNILPPKCWRNTVWSWAGSTETYVNLLLLNASANSHGEDLWTPLSPTPTSHQHSLLPCVNASLISYPTPSATSPPIWHPLPYGERPNIQFTPLHILTTLTDADWSMHVINRDTDSSDNKVHQNITFKAFRTTTNEWVSCLVQPLNCVGCSFCLFCRSLALFS